jgi:ribosomal protein S18 acetylase RimI-like enzyme
MQRKQVEDNVSYFFCDYSDAYHRSKLIALINHYIADPMGGGGAPLTADEQGNLLLGLSSHPSSFVLFIGIAKEIVGMVTCFINFSTFKAKPYLNIHDIIVQEEYRGKGLGRKLLEKCIEISRNSGYCKITLEVRDDNINAQYLYKSLDFKDSEPVMHFWTKIL